MERRCGDCQLCCRMLPLTTIGKPIGVRCQHQRHGKGCAVFGKFGRPASCAVWRCAWLADIAPELRRPDHAHYFVDPTPDFVVLGTNLKEGRKVFAISVWVDPSYPDVHRDPALRAFIARIAEEHDAVAVVRTGPEGVMTLIPPRMSDTGAWEERASTAMPRHSVGEIRKRMIEERLEKAQSLDAPLETDEVPRGTQASDEQA